MGQPQFACPPPARSSINPLGKQGGPPCFTFTAARGEGGGCGATLSNPTEVSLWGGGGGTPRQRGSGKKASSSSPQQRLLSPLRWMATGKLQGAGSPSPSSSPSTHPRCTRDAPRCGTGLSPCLSPKSCPAPQTTPFLSPPPKDGFALSCSF